MGSFIKVKDVVGVTFFDLKTGKELCVLDTLVSVAENNPSEVYVSGGNGSKKIVKLKKESG